MVGSVAVGVRSGGGTARSVAVGVGSEGGTAGSVAGGEVLAEVWRGGAVLEEAAWAGLPAWALVEASFLIARLADGRGGGEGPEEVLGGEAPEVLGGETPAWAGADPCRALEALVGGRVGGEVDCAVG